MLEDYQDRFSDFVQSKLTAFYHGLEDWYGARGKTRDSLSYFRNHWPKFEASLTLCTAAGLHGLEMEKVSEFGSFYPYTVYWFKLQNNDLLVDLYDIILREAEVHAEPYDVDGVRLIDFNLCTDEFTGEGQYDFILLSEVLEHLTVDLVSFQGKVVEQLKVGGHLLVTYPLGAGGHPPVNPRDYDVDFSGKLGAGMHEGHLREFTVETAAKFFPMLSLVMESGVFRYKAYGRMIAKLYKKV